MLRGKTNTVVWWAGGQLHHEEVDANSHLRPEHLNSPALFVYEKPLADKELDDLRRYCEEKYV